ELALDAVASVGVQVDVVVLRAGGVLADVDADADARRRAGGPGDGVGRQLARGGRALTDTAIRVVRGVAAARVRDHGGVQELVVADRRQLDSPAVVATLRVVDACVAARRGVRVEAGAEGQRQDRLANGAVRDGEVAGATGAVLVPELRVGERAGPGRRPQRLFGS